MSALSVNFSLEEITQMVFDKLDPKLSRDLRTLIANTIVKNLEKSPVGISQVYKSFLGIEPSLKYSVGDKVYVKKAHLYIWRFHKELMEPRYFKDALLVEITETDLYKQDAYSVTYEYVNQDGNMETGTQSLLEGQIAGIEDGYPLNM